MTMSDTEKLNRVESEIAIIKRWWPVVAVLFTFGGLLISGTHFFDDNIATKADITAIHRQIDSLRVAIMSLKNDYGIAKNTDTIYRLTVNNKVDNLIQEIKYIEHRHGYVIEHTNTPGADPTTKHIQ